VGAQRICIGQLANLLAHGEKKHLGTPKLKKAAPEPFTLAHFAQWASELTLDTEQPWEIEDFQAWFVEDLFLGLPANWLIVPEGNAKTTLTAGLAVYHAEFRTSAFAPIGASSREQAETLFRQAEGFIVRSDRLNGNGAKSGLFETLPGYRLIRGKEPNTSRIQVYAADEKTGDGVIPTLAIIDEPHRQKNMGLYRTWRGKLTKRKGQIVAISTSGEPGSEFETTRDKIRQSVEVVERTETFLRGRSPSMVFHEWAMPEKGDVEDLELVKRCNPLKAMTLAEIAGKRESPDWNLAHWRRMVCNLPTREENSAITEAEWYAARSSEQIPAGQSIFLGLDLGWKWDTTAAVPFWHRDHGFRLFGPAEVLVPPRNGDSTHPQTIKDAILRIHARNPIDTVVMDMTNGEEIAHWLEDELRATVVDRTQNNPNAIQDYACFMEALRNGWLKHSGDAALKSHALNAIARLLPSGVRFDRVSSSRAGTKQDQRVIDALTAAAMVHAVAVITEPVEVVMAAWR
jgi:phage terminase large subunit-like protein